MSTSPPLLPTYFISHGGGPWPWMETGGAYDRLAESLARMPAEAGPGVQAMLMVSAHWEAPMATVQTHPQPPMLYDYGGFPEHTYRVQYPAPGSPALAARVRELLAIADLPSAEDAQRGFDHGLFSPMAVAWPQADLPVIQLSLLRGLDPAAHLVLGRALAPLRREGVLIVGSGLSYHNLRAFNATGREASAQFDAWLQGAVGQTGGARNAALTQWQDAPAARAAHPREEHLLPLMVVVGAAENDAAQRVYHEAAFMGALTVSSWRFG